MSLEYGIINDNITVMEVEGAIDFLKNNKGPGVDGIPSEFIEICKFNLSSDFAPVLNYIIGLRDFKKNGPKGYVPRCLN